MSTTTPYRANVPTHQSPYQTPSRRALGDLTPRAINSPSTISRNAASSEVIQARSPLKKITSHIPNGFADKENLLAAVSSHGKKRSIEEVDDVEKAGGTKMLAHGKDASLWTSGMSLTAAAMQQHTVRCTTLATRHARADLLRKITPLVLLIQARPPSATRLHQSLNPYRTRKRATSPSLTFSTMSSARVRKVNTQERLHIGQRLQQLHRRQKIQRQNLAPSYCARDSSLASTRSRHTKKTRRAWI